MNRPVKIVSIILLSLLFVFFLPQLKNGLRSLFNGDVPVSFAREVPGEGVWTPHNINLGSDRADQDNTDSSIIFDENTFKERITIGVILPLSGDYAAFGKSVLNGIFLASGVFGPWSAELLPIDIIVKDSKGDSLVTVNAVEELFSENVIAIIGPLLSKTSVAGVLKAQELKIPIISLSQKDDLPEFGEYVFRNSMTSTMQARTLVHDIFFNLGLQKFAILYPDNSYGRHLKDAFIREAEQLEGEVVILEPYQEEQTDFGEEIKKIFQITEGSDSTDKDRKKTFEPVIEFDALYIPDYSDRVVLIIPQLVYYNVKDLQLLGSNGWNSPRLMDVERDYIEGAIFTDGFFINSKNRVIRSFKKNFEETFEILPGILEAQAFDATKMIISIINEKQTVDRVSLKNYLYELKNYPGVTGQISFDQNGEAQKEIFLLKAESGRIVQVNWEENYFKLSEEEYEQEYEYDEDEESVY
jgi:ABC-type branched-subunit amino acid transport system substrate-binding protein